MSQSRIRPILVFLGITLLGANASPAQDAPEESTPPTSEEAQVAPPTDPREVPIPYVPPVPEKPAPEVRTAGLTRGAETGSSVVTLLVPEHVGLTVRSNPIFYWYGSADTSVRIEITLIDEESVKPLLEFSLQGPVSTGIQELRLADHDIDLEPTQIYEWSVTLVEKPGRRSAADRIAKSFVERVAPSEELAAALADAKPRERAAVYARHGIWYDALSELSEQLGADPSNVELARLRDALLAQVGIDEPRGASTSTGP